MASELAVQLDECEVATEYEVVVNAWSRVITTRLVLADPHAPWPWPVHFVSPDLSPLHLLENEVKRVRLVCPNCDSVLWETGERDRYESWELPADEENTTEPFVSCFDCDWEPVDPDDPVAKAGWLW